LGYKFLIVSVLFLSSTLQIKAQSDYSNLEFVENKGQWDSSQHFRAQFPTGTFYIQKHGFRVLMHNPDELQAIEEQRHGHALSSSTETTTKSSSAKKPLIQRGNGAPNILHSHIYQVSFLNDNEQAEFIPDKPLPTYNNYFIGNDRTKWASGCKVYQGITYKNIYPNVDLRYFTDAGTLRYDLILHPGADPDRIVMKYEGSDKLSIRNRQLIIKTSVGEAKEMEPYSYQLNPTGRTEVDVKYVLSPDNTVRFKIKNFSPDKELIIDPTLVFCTFTGSRSDNWGYTATYDAAGNFYSGSIVLDESEGGNPNGSGFGATLGAFQTTYQGGDQSEGPGWDYDVGIMKFNSSGTKKLYATYLGGAGDEQPHSLVVDNAGNLIVAGRTSSVATFPGTLFGVGGGFDIFVSKFNSNGTALIGSMRIGGDGADGVNIAPKYSTAIPRGTNSLRLNYGDDGRSEVIIDPSDNIYVASCTRSLTGSPANNFPTTPGVFQPNPGGGNQDGVVIKLNPTLTNVLFSSYLGGNNDDAAFDLAMDPNTGRIYVGGGTASTDFPGTTGHGLVLFPANSGGIDGFVSIISANGDTLVKSSYFGTKGTEIVYGVQFDKFGSPYIMGTTTGSWMVVNAKYSQTGGKQFVSKLSPDLSQWQYSTVFGTNSTYPNLSPTAFLVDKCQNVYIAGWGGGIDITDGYNSSGTKSMAVTSGAIQKTTDGADFYFIVIKKNADSLLYATFFGQNGGFPDHVDGGTSRFDKQGIIYEAMCANCYGPPNIFPTSLGVVFPKNGTGSLGCNLAAVKIAFNFAGVSAGLKSTINGIPDTSGCVSLDVLLSDTVRNAKTYIWNFGDGSPPVATTNFQVPHTYAAIGTYTVMLIAIDSSTCNVSDTAYIHIRARNDKASLALDAMKLPPCESLSYQFSNLSTAPPGKPFSDTSFVWDFGDGSPQVPAGVSPPSLNHSYASAGTYIVRLLMVDTNYCNYPDEIDDTLRVAPLVKAQFVTPATGCVPYAAYFDNTSLAGQQFFWNFGDGTTSTVSSPSHLYPNVGTYTISLVAVDSNTCNKIDSTSTTISVNPLPTAAFTYSPQPPEPNKPTIFNNSSIGATHYKWLFGDGDTAISNSLDTVMHQYERTGTFNACLIAFNQFECPDTACGPVETIVNPLLAMPNAFTPGHFGQNGVIKVQSFGITALVFRIYNRWGQLVFETNDPNQGWDGTFRGNPQPMDVYAYTIEAQFFDGTKTTRKGDITLIR
jgi:gliding motility-associated-like protein